MNTPRFAVDLATVLLVGLIWFGIVAFLQIRKKKSFVYLVFFTLFYVYLCKVLDYTLYQFQSLLLLKYITPELILNGQASGESTNLVPLVTLTLQDVRTSILNILLLIPFGFGLPFITDLRMKGTVVAGALLSLAIELLQLMTGLMAATTFRVTDINDVLFNVLGVAIGYLLFLGFMHVYQRISHELEPSANPILAYIAQRPQIDQQR